MKMSNFFKDTLKQSFTITLVLILVCGFIYPLVMNGLSALLFPYRAAGSIIEIGGEKVGSEFVGQDFTEDYFMKGRPSAVNYNTYKIDENGEKVYNNGEKFTGLTSGSQNLAPSNPALKERVEKSMNEFLEKNPHIKKEDIPADLMTASGSGLDPHISKESALIQLPSISKASGLDIKMLEEIVEDSTQGRFLGIFGNETVNVLKVNIAIADAMGILKA